MDTNPRALACKSIEDRTKPVWTSCVSGVAYPFTELFVCKSVEDRTSPVWTCCESGAGVTGRLMLAAMARFQTVDLIRAPDAVSIGTGRV